LPEGVVFDGKDFRTAKIGLAYELTNTLTTTPVPLGEPQGFFLEPISP